MGLKNEIRFLVFMTIIFSIINNYITIFINLYIWEGNHSVSQVAWFNVAMLSFWAVSFLLGGKVFTRYSLRVNIRISSIAAIFAFGLLLTIKSGSAWVWTILIGGSTGIMCGFYYISQNMFISLYGHGEDFKNYFAITNIAQQILSIINPLVFALLIKWFGYSASFVAICLIVCILFTLTFYIPHASVSEEDRDKPFFRINHPIQSFPMLRTFLISSIIMGAIIQFQVLFIQLSTFAITDNKMIIAALNVLYATLTIVTFRFVKKKTLSLFRWIQVGGTLMIGSYLVALYPTTITFIMVNILASLGYFLFMTNWNANQFLYLSHFKSITLTKMVVVREIMIIIGRIVLLCFMAQVEEFDGIYYTGLILISILAVGMLIYVERKVVKSRVDTGASDRVENMMT